MQGATGGSPAHGHVNRRSSYGSIKIDPSEDTYHKQILDYHHDALSDQDTIKASSRGAHHHVDHYSSTQYETHKAANKVQSLVSDVVATEKRCEWLTERNAWLTAKLLQSQRGFIERMLMSNSTEKRRRCFEAWHNMMAELRLEKQLHEMSTSCERLQKMGKDCSVVLEREQQLKEQAELALAEADEEVRRVSAENANLRRQIEADTRRMALLERRLTEAETTIFRSRKDAQGVIEAITSYDETRELLDKEASGPLPEQSILDQSLQMRQEVTGTIDRIGSVLGRTTREASPTRMVSQPSPMPQAPMDSMTITHGSFESGTPGQLRGNVSPPRMPRTTQYMGAQPSTMMGAQMMTAPGQHVHAVGPTNAYTSGVHMEYSMGQRTFSHGELPAYGQMNPGLRNVQPMYSQQPGPFLGAATPIFSRAQSPGPVK